MDKTKSYKKEIPLKFRIYKSFMSLLSKVFPYYAAERAYFLWFKSPRYAVPAREKKWRARAKVYYVHTNTHKVAVYQWLPEDTVDARQASSAPVVVLLHGWSGRATQMGAFVQPLLDSGFQVVALDAPGHGLSSGSESNFFEIEEALQKVCDSLGSVTGFIAHSFGTLVLAYALRHSLRCDSVVLLSSPNDMLFLVQRFCKAISLSDKAQAIFLRKLEQRFNDNIWNMLTAEINASYLDVPALIIHDKNDEGVPVNMSRRLASAWRNSELLITDGLGHTRILRNKAVIEKAVRFIRNNTINR